MRSHQCSSVPATVCSSMFHCTWYTCTRRGKGNRVKWCLLRLEKFLNRTNRIAAQITENVQLTCVSIFDNLTPDCQTLAQLVDYWLSTNESGFDSQSWNVRWLWLPSCTGCFSGLLGTYPRFLHHYRSSNYQRKLSIQAGNQCKLCVGAVWLIWSVQHVCANEQGTIEQTD